MNLRRSIPVPVLFGCTCLSPSAPRPPPANTFVQTFHVGVFALPSVFNLINRRPVISMEKVSELALPEAFIEFLEANSLDSSIYSAVDSTPRYVRLKPGGEAHVEEIEDAIKFKLAKVGWLPGFYALPPNIQISNSKPYKEGKIYGIDAASGAAVLALGIGSGDHVLDLCAAPGAKLCMLLECLGDLGSVTGVDVARHRLAACRTMVQKYNVGDRCRLFVADGTTFDLLPLMDHSSYESAMEVKTETFGEWSSRRPWKERKRMAKATAAMHSEHPELIFYGVHSGLVGLVKLDLYKPLSDNSEASISGYDKVLVDAECTHDGSVRHIQKFENCRWKTFEHSVLNADRTDSLTTLQMKLLRNGFRLLKVGGSLVYSTCSLTAAQNEDIIGRFLQENAYAKLEEIELAKDWPCKSGQMEKTLRFDPVTSQTSGLFVAKLTKLAS